MALSRYRNIRTPTDPATMANMLMEEVDPVPHLTSVMELWVLDSTTMITMFGDHNSTVSYYHNTTVRMIRHKLMLRHSVTAQLIQDMWHQRPGWPEVKTI